MAPPSAEYVTELFGSIFEGGAFQKKSFEKYLAPEFTVNISGRDFVCSGEGYDLSSFMTDVMEPIAASIDTSKSKKFTLVRIIAGNSPWVAIEGKATATSKKGKPWVHEFMMVPCFNDDGKITQLKGFMDTQHIHNHVMECSA